MWRILIITSVLTFGMCSAIHAETDPDSTAEDADAGQWLRDCVAGLSMNEIEAGQGLCTLDSVIPECPGSSAIEVNACARHKHEAWMLMVEETYQALVSRFDIQADGVAYWDDGETLARLVQAQEDWAAFKNSQCLWEASEYLGGSGESTLAAACRAQMAEARGWSLLREKYWRMSR